MNKSSFFESKFFTKDILVRQLNIWRFQQKKIVFTNGCFDILHKGHIHLLSKAIDLGDILIVGLNSDLSVQKLKGPNRPFQDENTRKMILSSLYFVDAVITFEEETPLELIKIIKPDVLVKGGDYKDKKVVGANFIHTYGGEVKVIEYLEGYSTSSIADKLMNVKTHV